VCEPREPAPLTVTRMAAEHITDPDSARAAMPDLQAAGFGSPFDPSVPHPARVYGYWLNGKDHFPADRRVAEEVMEHRPQVVSGARANREFLVRVTQFLAGEAGIRQFLDIGAGLPAPGSVHEVAQAIAPACRIVYADNDPMVVAHLRALMSGSRSGALHVLDADLRDSGALLAGAAATLDFSKPVAVLLLAIMHLVPDADGPARIVQALASPLAPGSYLAISHLTADFAPQAIVAAAGAYNAAVPVPVTPRTHAQVSALFSGLSLVAPGVVPVCEWRPRRRATPPPPADLYAGAARIGGRVTLTTPAHPGGA
jgi:S-adenosyl methyltransferase